ncbi:MAG: hypothetical protein QM708_10490 [Propioniciclava sp.]|uniref:hypothetical protein n=1 Tax=Propioniciclava sp. TaxID=2038686 RepID=UPI0039E40825
MTRPDIPPDAGAELDAVDAALLSQIAALYDRIDPAPATLADEICLALALAELDADLAAFERSDQGVGVRSHDYQRVSSLTFSVGTWSMLVTVTPLDGTFVRLDGWLTGDASARVELRERARSTALTADEGRFTFGRVERGLVQFLVTSSDPGARPVITPHVEV